MFDPPEPVTYLARQWSHRAGVKPAATFRSRHPVLLNAQASLTLSP